MRRNGCSKRKDPPILNAHHFIPLTHNKRNKKSPHSTQIVALHNIHSVKEEEFTGFDAQQGFHKSKKIVHFNGDGQPIGEGSTSFVSYLGSASRKHCPISYEHWKDVPDHIKETIWKLVTDNYTVPLSHKEHILQRINKHWREFKSKLRSKHYDKYKTDDERKLNCPRGVESRDWYVFVDNQSTPNAQARRHKGKSAREAMRTPHTFGRRGAARAIKSMAKGNARQIHQQQDALPEGSGLNSTLYPEPEACEDRSGFNSTLCPEPAPCEDLGSKQKKMVYFHHDGQPIGEGSVSFTSNLGALSRKHCPVCYEQWKDVPDQIKETIWKHVTDKYILSVIMKEQILKRVSKHWREFKCQLRSKHYDKYDTDAEKKKNCPRGIEQKDWNIFVDNQSTPDAKARRSRGKSARGAMKTPNRSGRRGVARAAEDLVTIASL